MSEPPSRRRWAVLLAVSLPLPVGVIGGWINTALGGGMGFDEPAHFLSGALLGACIGVGLAIALGRYMPFGGLRRVSLASLVMLLGLVVYVTLTVSRA